MKQGASINVDAIIYRRAPLNHLEHGSSSFLSRIYAGLQEGDSYGGANVISNCSSKLKLVYDLRKGEGLEENFSELKQHLSFCVML